MKCILRLTKWWYRVENVVSDRKFVAYIDPDNKFAVEDKLSQINTLEQMSNIASYGFLKKRLETHDLHVKCSNLTK